MFAKQNICAFCVLRGTTILRSNATFEMRYHRFLRSKTSEPSAYSAGQLFCEAKLKKQSLFCAAVDVCEAKHLRLLRTPRDNYFAKQN